MNRLTFFLTVAFTFFVTAWLPAQEPASKTDPIVGRWIWVGARNVTINANGTAVQPGEATAEWKLLHDGNTNERKYEFIWSRNGGKTYIHTVVLSNDGQHLDGKNQVNQRVWAKRVN